MFTLLSLTCLALAQDSTRDLPVLHVGEAVEGEITNGDPPIHTPTLEAIHADTPVLGRTFLIEIEESNIYTIELRSDLFDAYLVLRDGAGNVRFEDDDGGVGIHARIAGELEAGMAFSLEACALHGERGAFELQLSAGARPAVSSDEDLEGLRRTVAIRERVLGPDHPATAGGLTQLAHLLRDQADYAAARPLYERALAIRERAFGPAHPESAQGLNNLANLLMDQGDYARARALQERALAIYEEAFGPDHPETALSLDNLAVLLHAQGDYVAARSYLERTIGIREKVLGPEHLDTARSLNDLAVLLCDQGDQAAARPLCERVLAIREKVLGPEHPETATSLGNLARLLDNLGDYAAAANLGERALAAREKALGREHPDTALSLHNLAVTLQAQGDYAAAQAHFERALAIKEKVLGPEHVATAESLDSLAVLLEAKGDHLAAQPYFERALAIFERVLGPEHPDTAQSLNNLAELLYSIDEPAAARPYYERALLVQEKALGPEHPETTLSQHNLSFCLADLGLTSEAWRLSRAASSSSLGYARRVLWSLSERERLDFLRDRERNLRLCLTAATWAPAEGADVDAYELSLAWRGLVSRSLLAGRDRLRASVPEAAAQTLVDLRQVQSDLSKQFYAEVQADPRALEARIRSLRERRNALEVELQRLAGPSTDRAVTLAELCAGLSPGAAFLDFFVHPLYEPARVEDDKVVHRGAWSVDHLSAWIVRPDRALVRVDLGPAAEIEHAARSWLHALVSHRGLVASRGVSVSSGNRSVEEAGLRLRTLLWEPLATQLDGVGRVFVQPDSFLGTLPLEVIPLPGGRYLIEEKSFVYVRTPLDPVARKDGSECPNSLLVAGAVDFRKREEVEVSPFETAVPDASRPRGNELPARLNLHWDRLPHTESEARTVLGLFESAFAEGESLCLVADAPTEERLKQELPEHSCVHIATHGFFHPEGAVSMWDSAREHARETGSTGPRGDARDLVGQLPGLLTGLVCAGANEPAPAGRDDGLLTAEEVLWLDLSRVELVVLSACETALGEHRSGEGMIGLRRAFGLAGAKTVVSSLWSVQDESTARLMQGFYTNLWQRKMGRGEALRTAQLEMLARNRAEHGDALPATWGAFVLSGEWR